jgi:hypothetical protein
VHGEFEQVRGDSNINAYAIDVSYVNAHTQMIDAKRAAHARWVVVDCARREGEVCSWRRFVVRVTIAAAPTNELHYLFVFFCFFDVDDVSAAAGAVLLVSSAASALRFSFELSTAERQAYHHNRSTRKVSIRSQVRWIVRVCHG